MSRKKSSQLFTFPELVRNNKKIFSKQYPRSWRENDSHYISKVYFGEQIRKRYPTNYMEVIYEFQDLPVLGTEADPRHYIPDIFIFYRNQTEKKMQVSIIEIDGLIHKASKHQYNKTKWKREAITDYFTNFDGKIYDNWPLIFSYISLEPDDFLYNKLDFFMDIFEDKFNNGGSYPEIVL